MTGANPVGPLQPLLGQWTGEGRGWYPTVADFAYREEATFTAVGQKPLVAYSQRTFHADDGRPLHAETGYFRLTDSGTIELVLAHPNGYAEVSTVVVTDDGGLDVETLVLTPTPTAKPVVGIRRRFRFDGDDVLAYELDMEAMALPMQGHLQARLTRQPG